MWTANLRLFQAGLAVVFGLGMGGQPSFADDFDRSTIRDASYCFPAKYVTEMARKIADVDDSKRDVVDITMSPKFKIYDGGTGPDRFYLKTEQSETDFTVTEDYAVPDFLGIVKQNSGKGDICIDDKARMGRPGDDENLYFEMGLIPKCLSPVPSIKTMKRFGIGEKKIYTQNDKGEWVL